MAQRNGPGDVAVLPSYRVSDAEWAAVPRTVPDWILRWGGYLPYLGLVIWCFTGWTGTRDDGGWRLVLPNDSDAYFLGYFTVLVLAVVAPAAGRLTPWICLGATGLLLALGTGSRETTTAAWAVGGVLLALGLAGSLSGLRLTLLVRSWRQAAGTPVQVEAGLLRSTRSYRPQSGWMRWAALMVVFTVLYLLVKTVVLFVLRVGGDMGRIGEVWDPRVLEYALLPLIGLVFWTFIGAIGWANAKLAGDVLLDVPVDPRIGPLGYSRAALAIGRKTAAAPGCGCGSVKQRSDATLPLLPVDDACAVHGIDAVNGLDARSFLAVAAQTWVWGANAEQLPVPAGERLRIMGMHGWGSRPAVAGTPVPVNDAGRVTHDGYQPAKAIEVNRRADRDIDWSDASGWMLPDAEVPGGSPEPIDRLRLDAIGLRGTAVRVRGARPRFEADPGVCSTPGA